MLNDFIKETEREFDGKFELYRAKEPDGRLYGAEIYELKSFTSSKLREFAGEFRKKVEGMKENSISNAVQESEGAVIPTEAECEGEIKWNAALDSILNLLDGVGKE